MGARGFGMQICRNMRQASSGPCFPKPKLSGHIDTAIHSIGIDSSSGVAY